MPSVGPQKSAWRQESEGTASEGLPDAGAFADTYPTFVTETILDERVGLRSPCEALEQASTFVGENTDRGRDAYYYAPPAQSRYVRLSRIRLPPWVVDGLAKRARHAVCGPAHVTHLPDTEFGA